MSPGSISWLSDTEIATAVDRLYWEVINYSAEGAEAGPVPWLNLVLKRALVALSEQQRQREGGPESDLIGVLFQGADRAAKSVALDLYAQYLQDRGHSIVAVDHARHSIEYSRDIEDSQYERAMNGGRGVPVNGGVRP